MLHKHAVLVGGPTASGKTAFALELAEALDGEIISVDSALVYRGLDIGAAKPTESEQARVRHHLIDIRAPWDTYSAAEFVTDAVHAINDIHARGKLPVLAGGTSLYARALMRGLADMPAADPDVRAEIELEAARDGWPALHARLAEVDPPAAARIHSTDPQRISRALEVYRLTGQPISALQKNTRPPTEDTTFLQLALMPESKDTLRARITQRFDQMLADGFLAEVEGLRHTPEIARHPDPLSLPALRAVGYRQAWLHLSGETDFETFRETAIFATRSLAKRQLTWLKREPEMQLFDPSTQRVALLECVGTFLEASGDNARHRKWATLS